MGKLQEVSLEFGEQVTVESSSKKKTTKCSAKRFFLCVLFLLGLGVFIFAFCFPTLKSIALDHEIKQQSMFYKRDIRNTKDELRKKINDTEKSLRRLTDERMADIEKEIDEIRQKNTGDRPVTPKAGTDLRQKFKEMNDHLNSLISTVGKLSSTLSRMNVSSESKMFYLHRNFNDTRNDLIRLRNELSHLNYSLHTYMAHLSSSIVSTVKDLQHELLMLSNSTSRKTNELWKHWNRTDEEIEDIVKLMAQQNESLHFKIAYHSDALRSEVKDVEKKQSRFHNYTKKSLQKLGSELYNTRENLRMSFNDEISQVNRSLHKAIENIDGNLRSSITKINAKVDGMKTQLQTNINDVVKTQKQLKDDFSETKEKLQEKDRKHDSAISGEKSKMENMEQRMKDLEETLDSKTRKIANQEKDIGKLRNRIEKIENAANALKTDITLAIFLSLITLYGMHATI